MKFRPWFTPFCLAVVSSSVSEAQEILGQLEPLTVIGNQEAVLDLPGSGYFVPNREIREQNYTNINRVLARVPGVYVREEDGYGNFPNVSIRGVDGTRMEKVTVMEDGILTAPATYSAPAAYYSPKVGRMSGVEVLKGSSQVRYGPHTSGGVINYLSTPVPAEETFYLRATYGSDNTILGHAYYGNTVETKNGQVGFLLELFQNQADGFREIDAATGYAGSNDTGYSVTEPMLKVFWEPDSAIRQRFEFKYGYTDFEADESYLGLTEADVRRTPDRRYAATRFDNFQSQQHRAYLKYLVEPTEDLKFETALYYNEFKRNWYKLNAVRRVGGVSGNNLGLFQALLDPDGLALLQGRGEGDLRIRANSRGYRAYGARFSGDYDFETGPVSHQLHFGTRLHRDEIRRFQRNDLVTQDATGAVTNIAVGENGSGGNRFQEAEALAFWIQDDITFGSLTITPGLRYEHVDGEFTDFESNSSQTVVRNRSGSLDAWVPGISFKYELSPDQRIFGGVHKGISFPSPRNFLRDTDVEESIGYELGYRAQLDRVNFEVVGFLTDFDNLIATDDGFGISTNSRNAGQAEVYGVEFLANTDLLSGDGSSQAPVYFSATWTQSELQEALASGGGDDIYAGGQAGAELPYVPEWKLAAGIGYSNECWGVSLDGSYVSSSFGTAANFDAPVDSARQGKIDSLLLFDLSGHYQINDSVKLLGGLANLTDERGIISRIPHGPRTNQGRTWYLGAEILF